MNGLDLSQFQFDYDQTWSVIFFRPNGETVLARYGSRTDKDGMKHNSFDGFRDAMARVLAVQNNWSDELVPYYLHKRGPKSKYTTADEIPSDTIRKIRSREADGKASCIHCHNVYDAKRDASIASGKYNPKSAFRYPLLSSLGLKQAADSVIPSEASIANGSADYFLRINGQHAHTLADVQFALEHADTEGSITIATIPLRNDKGEQTFLQDPVRSRNLDAALGWKEQGDIGWRASMYGMPPRLGLWVQALSNADKKTVGFAANKLAIKVRGVFGAEVRKAGLKKGDIITQFGDKTTHHTEGAFHAHVRLNYHKPNSKLRLKILRNNKPIELTVRFANPS